MQLYKMKMKMKMKIKLKLLHGRKSLPVSSSLLSFSFIFFFSYTHHLNNKKKTQKKNNYFRKVRDPILNDNQDKWKTFICHFKVIFCYFFNGNSFRILIKSNRIVSKSHYLIICKRLNELTFLLVTTCTLWKYLYVFQKFCSKKHNSIKIFF